MGLLLWWKPFDADDVATLKGLIAAGKVTPVIDRRYPLSEIVRGAPLGRRRSREGKVIIAM